MLYLSPLQTYSPKLVLQSVSHSLSPHKSLSFTPLTKTLFLSRRPLKIQCIDAAQSYDYESKVAAKFDASNKLKIAIIGFGNFGQFLAKTLVRQGHTVLAYSRSDYTKTAKELKVSFFSDPNDLCEEHPEVILLCTSVISAKLVLQSMPLQRLKRNTLIVDVLSVKEFPKNLLLNLLPNDFDLICAHPMFGPESGRYGWNGLYFVYETVRVGDEESRVSRCEKFLNIFADEGCKMVEMNCAEHDKHAAESQFVTHTIGRVLEKLKLESTPINTKGYEALLDLVENTASDSFDLYYGLFMYNKNAMNMLKKLDSAFEDLRDQLVGGLYDVVRDQLFGPADMKQISPVDYTDVKYANNGSANSFPSEAVR